MLKNLIVENSLNNRELSILFWFSILLVYLCLDKKIRKSIFECLKILVSPKMLIILTLMFFYTVVVIALMYQVGLWNFFLLKNTALWFFFSGFSFLVKSASRNKKIKIRYIFLDNLKIAFFVEFITNTFTFSLIGELVFIPFMSILGLFIAVASLYPELKKAESFLNRILVIIGLSVFTYSVREIFQSYESLELIKLIQDFLLPIELALLFLPFFYFFVLNSMYEQIFVLFYLIEEKGGRQLAMFGKRKIFEKCLFSMKKLELLVNNPFARSALICARSEKEINEIITKVLSNQEVIVRID